jgi:acyl dehydratase
MKQRYFEDLKVGDRFRSATCEVTEDAILAFGREFDPQLFHINPATASETIFKGLIASGWHTAALSMRLFVDAMEVPGGIIGLGVDELRWPVPVRPGDQLKVETEIIALRLSRSNPNNGIIRLKNITTNQRGEIVQSMLAAALVPKRTIGST